MRGAADAAGGRAAGVPESLSLGVMFSFQNETPTKFSIFRCFFNVFPSVSQFLSISRLEKWGAIDSSRRDLSILAFPDQTDRFSPCFDCFFGGKANIENFVET